MSTYAISDIHGCFDEFVKLLRKISFSNSDTLYILGDIVDRGPKSAEMIKWLVDKKANHSSSNVKFLMGNHEQMMTYAFDGVWSNLSLNMDSSGPWKKNGGYATMVSLTKALDEGTLSETDLDVFEEMVKTAPKVAYVEMAGTGLVVMCHAGIQPPDKGDAASDKEWFYQSEDDLLWTTRWYTCAETPPFIVVSGHVPTCTLAAFTLANCPDEVYFEGVRNRIMSWNNKYAIDCGSCFGGNVGALRIDDWQGFYANCPEYSM